MFGTGNGGFLVIFEMDPSRVVLWDFWLENSRRTPAWQSRRAGGCQMEMEGNLGHDIGFSSEFFSRTWDW